MMSSRATLADALHAAGKRDEAAHLFADAEESQKKLQPARPLLHSVQGHRYCDLLRAKGDHAAARRRASQALEWAAGQASSSISLWIR